MEINKKCQHECMIDIPEFSTPTSITLCGNYTILPAIRRIEHKLGNCECIYCQPYTEIIHNYRSLISNMANWEDMFKGKIPNVGFAFANIKTGEVIFGLIVKNFK